MGRDWYTSITCTDIRWLKNVMRDKRTYPNVSMSMDVNSTLSVMAIGNMSVMSSPREKPAKRRGMLTDGEIELVPRGEERPGHGAREADENRLAVQHRNRREMMARFLYRTGTSALLSDSRNEDGSDSITAFTVSSMVEYIPCTSLGEPQSCMEPFPNRVSEVAVPVHKLGRNLSFVDVLVAMDDVVPVLSQTLLE
ncbi:hypothetical protein DL765_003019 [Monosporascus sp. GIB2]|nr:hypothetical protein DL765_003019 [Monosporascus sp. GIB2]